MSSHRSRAVFTWLFVIVFIASVGICAAFADRLSAGFQLFLYAVILSSLILALATGCYQVLEPGEVLVVFGRSVPPKVRRGGAFVFPVISQVSRLRLSPMWIEFPKDGTSDGKIALNRENRLITKDGLPVTTLARVQIAAAGDDSSIIKVIESFGQKGELEVKEHFTKLLGGTVAKIIAETNAEDLRDHHQVLVDSVQDGLQFEAFGYRRTSQVTIGPVTQLSVAEAGLVGGDEIRAKRVLDILQKEESIRKIEQTSEISAATTESEKEQIQQDISKYEEQEKKAKIEHDSKKNKAHNEAELAILKVKGEEDVEKRRIEMAGTIKRAELERDKALADLEVDKLIEDAKIEKEEHNLRVAAADSTKVEDLLRARADSEVGALRLKFNEEQQQSAIRLRGELLKQNVENPEGDLELQLKKLVLRACVDLSRDSATVIAAALSKANVTLIGDPSAAAQLATEQMKALGLGVRGKEILALLQDARLHDAVASMIQGLRTAQINSQPPTTAPTAHNTTADRVDGSMDNQFEP